MKQSRKLFCEYGPVAYWLSVQKCRAVRHMQNAFSSDKFARTRHNDSLPYSVKDFATILHRDSLLFDQVSEQNKAHNVQLALPKFTHIIVNPNEILSFCILLGNCSARKGYKPARVLMNNKPAMAIGGGLCQISNMINYLALHSKMTRVEYHDHDWADLYPEFGVQVPFGTGTSTFYNYRDLRFKNDTDIVYQFVFFIKDNHLHGQLLSDKPQNGTWSIYTPEEYFSRDADNVYRIGRIMRKWVSDDGNHSHEEEIKSYRAKLLYDAGDLVKSQEILF